MLSLAVIVELAQTLGSAAVVVTLVFVGVQLRASTRATQAASHHAVTAALNKLNLFWARETDAAKIWLAGLKERNALSPEERWRFDAMLRTYMHICETMYIQAALGAGDDDIVSAEADGIKAVFNSQSAREWWSENPFGFSRSFRTYIKDLLVLDEDDRN